MATDFVDLAAQSISRDRTARPAFGQDNTQPRTDVWKQVVPGVLTRKRRAVQSEVRGFGHGLSRHDGLELKPRRDAMGHRHASSLERLRAQR
jgi:hypothetical protein